MRTAVDLAAAHLERVCELIECTLRAPCVAMTYSGFAGAAVFSDTRFTGSRARMRIHRHPLILQRRLSSLPRTTRKTIENRALYPFDPVHVPTLTYR